MAKAKEPEKPEKLEKQEPEKPAKKKGGSKLPMIIGIVLGALVIQAAIVFIIFKFVIHSPGGSNAEEEADKERKAKLEKLKAERERQDAMIDDQAYDEEAFFAPENELHYTETGEIITNPKGSPQFVVINLGIEYRAKPEEGEAAAAEGESKDKSANGLPNKLNGQILNIVNNFLGDRSVEDLSSKRDSLRFYIKKDLDPIFRKTKKMYLRDVYLVKFIIQ